MLLWAVVHQAALAAALVCVFSGACRLVTFSGVTGNADRALCALVTSAAAIVIVSLLLGVTGAGMSMPMLVAVSVVLWALARLLFSTSAAGLFDGLVEWLRAGRRSSVLLALGGIGLALIWGIQYLRTPSLTADSATYHLFEAVAWAQGGRPGSRIATFDAFPTSSYPVTHEVLTSWVAAVSRSLAAPALTGLVALVVLVAAVCRWAQLLGAPLALRVLAVTAFAGMTTVRDQLHGNNTDLPAAAWLAVAAALSLRARGRVEVLPFVVIAAALAVGTKTPAAMFAVAVVVFAALPHLRAGALVRPAMMIGLAAAVGCGGIWYLRNLITHGSPLWPFIALPGGDRIPPFIAQFDRPFIAAPVAAVSGAAAAYRDALTGGLVLLPGAVLVSLLARRRAVIGLGAFIAASILLWSLTPLSGAPRNLELGRYLAFNVSAVRYLLPALLLSVMLCLAAAAPATRPRKGIRTSCFLVLGLTVAANLIVARGAGLLFLFPEVVVVVPIAAAAAAAAPHLLMRGRVVSSAIGASVVALAVVGLAFGSIGFTGRVRAPLLELPADPVRAASFDDSDFPVAMSPVPFAAFAGDRLQHRLVVLPRQASCESVRAHARRGWVVLAEWSERFLSLTRGSVRQPDSVRCLRGLAVVFEGSGSALYRRLRIFAAAENRAPFMQRNLGSDMMRSR